MRNIVSERNSNIINSKEKILVGYLLAGYPQKDTFLKLVADCETAGIDIFEIGFPSINPYSDGEVIRNAHERVDKSIFFDESYWAALREIISQPIWLMAYKSDLIDTGFYKKLIEKSLIDALVIPDISFEERQKLGEEIAAFGVDMVGFVNPEIREEELEACLSSTALVYQQLYSGPTGMSVVSDDFMDILEKARSHKHVKVFAGFGISTPQRVSQLLNIGFDGVIVGTAMIKNLNDSQEKLMTFVKELIAAVKQ